MAKYSFDFRLQVVQEYLNNEGGYKYLAKKFEISSYSMVENWVKSYEVFGEEGLMRSTKNKKYSFEFKLHMVELYLSTIVMENQRTLSRNM